MAKKVLGSKAGVREILLTIVGVAIFSLLCTLQNPIGWIFVVTSIIALIAYFVNLTKMAVLIELITFIILLYLVWFTDIFKIIIDSRGCFDICIGQDLMIWIVEGFSVLLIPFVVYTVGKVFWHRS
jgi:hypothetical protein